MKYWVKLILALAMGLLIGFFASPTGQLAEMLAQLYPYFINFGLFIIYPLAFCGLIMGTHKLTLSRRFWPVLSRAVFYLILGTALLVLLAIAFVVLLPIEKIPIFTEQNTPPIFLGPGDYIALLFPDNFFTIFESGAAFLLPLLAAGILIGRYLRYNPHTTQPIIALFNSFSDLFYRIGDMVIEVINLGLLAMSAYFVIQARSVSALGIFSQLLLLLTLTAFLVILVVFPLIIYLVSGRRENPYVWLFGILPCLAAALFSRNNYLQILYLTKFGRENMGIRRRLGAPVYFIFSLFCRGGSALIGLICFMVVLRSYSSLEIEAGGVLRIVIFAFLFSFTLASHSGGVSVFIFAMCRWFSHQFGQEIIEDGYLIFEPVFFILAGIGVLIDTALVALIAYLVARKEGLLKPPNPAEFI